MDGHDNGPGLGATEAQRRARTVYDRVDNKRTKSLLQQAKDWLKNHLADGELHDVIEMNKAARAEGIIIANLQAARKALNCVSVRIGAENKVRLPKEGEEGHSGPKAKVAKESFNDLSRNFEVCEDQHNVSTEERVRLGIKPTEQVCWMPSPEMYDRTPGANLQAWLRGNPGARVIKDNGGYVYNGLDTVLCVVPRALVEERLKANRIEALRVEAENAADEAGMNRPDDFDRSNTELMNSLMAANHASKVLAQSPSSGKTVEEFVRREGYSETQILRAEACVALPEHANQIRSMSDKEFMSLFDETTPERGGNAGQSRGAGGRFMSVGPNVRPRNLMSDADRSARGL